jgi:hypothetical protein
MMSLKKSKTNEIPITWLSGQYSYTAIINKELLKNKGFEKPDDVILEIKEAGLLIKKKEYDNT